MLVFQKQTDYKDGTALTRIKDAKERLTVLRCVDATSGILTVNFYNSQKITSRCLKEVNFFSVHYVTNKKTSITRDFFSDWFLKYFA